MADYTDPVPESTLRWFRPFGMALLALLCALPLAMLVDVVAGPFGRERLQWVIYVLGAIVFAALMQYSRHRRERDARRLAAGADGPPGGANLLVAGAMALLLSAVALALAVHDPGDDLGKLLGGASTFAGAGVTAVVVGLKRVRARRACRRLRGVR